MALSSQKLGYIIYKIYNKGQYFGLHFYLVGLVILGEYSSVCYYLGIRIFYYLFVY
jgi:hypothetical protein